jgi:putative Mg2+ transporter-C (MgtC) family protein
MAGLTGFQSVDVAGLTAVVPRLLLALLCGFCVGLNRDLHHKDAGFRTFSLVSLGSAVITLVMVHQSALDISAVSRVAQGIVTGIGFLGAGLILHRDGGLKVTGLTTAAAIWATASLGIASGLGLFVIVLPALLLILFVLTIGGPIERRIERLAHDKRMRELPPAPPAI